MDGELERYHKNNATLDLTIGDFKLKQNGLQKEVVRQRSATQDGEQAIRSAGGLCCVGEKAPALTTLRAISGPHHVRGHLQMTGPQANLSSGRPDWRLTHSSRRELLVDLAASCCALSYRVTADCFGAALVSCCRLMLLELDSSRLLLDSPGFSHCRSGTSSVHHACTQPNPAWADHCTQWPSLWGLQRCNMSVLDGIPP